MRANENIDRLMGLSAGTKMEHMGKGGGPIEVKNSTWDLSKLSDDELISLAALAAVASPMQNSAGNDPAGSRELPAALPPDQTA